MYKLSIHSKNKKKKKKKETMMLMKNMIIYQSTEETVNWNMKWIK